MKLLYLADDFTLPGINVSTKPQKIVILPDPNNNQEKIRFTPVIALLILFVFAGFSLTIPLHPTRSAVPNGCSTAVALPPGESTATCILQATARDNSGKSAERSAGLTKGLASVGVSFLVNGQAISVQLAKKFSRTVRNNPQFI